MKEEAFDEKKELQGSRTCIALNQVLKLPEGNCIHKFKNELSYVSVPLLLLFIERESAIRKQPLFYYKSPLML